MADFQRIIVSVWKTCSTARVALVSCTERQTSGRGRVRNSKLPPGTMLKHMAQTIVVFDTDTNDGEETIRLVKHPHRLPATVKLGIRPLQSTNGQTVHSVAGPSSIIGL